jgi:P-type conjugative transfer protein TrbJ
MRKILARCAQSAALALLPSALFLIPAEQAHAQFVVSDPPTEVSTFAQHVTQLMQYINEIQHALTDLQHLQLMQREVTQLIQHPSPNFLQDLNMITGVIQQTNGLALDFAQISQTFANQLSPYSPNPVVSYAAKYNTWATTALKALNGTAVANGLQGNLMQNGNQQAFMQQMQNLIQQPNGLDQGIQITNALGFATIQQLQGLQSTVAQNGASNAAALTATINAQQAGQTAVTNAFAPITVQADQRVW